MSVGANGSSKGPTPGSQVPGALGNAMMGRMTPTNVAANAAGPGAANTGIMSSSQMNQYLNGSPVATGGGVAQPMNNPFGNQPSMGPPQTNYGFPVSPPQQLEQMYQNLAQNMPSLNPQASPPMNFRGPDTGPAFNPAAGNEGNRTVTGTPQQVAQAAADAAQATALGHGLGGSSGGTAIQADGTIGPAPGHGLIRQNDGSYAPMVSMGGPGPNTVAGWGDVYKRMAGG